MENNFQKNFSWRNPWLVIILIGILLLAGILALSLIRERFVNQPYWQVNFTGQGKVVYEPDIANIYLGIKIDKKEKAEEALNELNDRINKIVEAIEKGGIAKTDIQTQSYNLSPHYDYVDNISKPGGYDANQTISVKVRGIKDKPSKPSQIIKIASEAGVNLINGISFEPDDLESIKQEARIKAIGDARKKAIDLSNRLGVKLGKIVGWWENFNPPVTYYADYGKGGYGGGEAANPSLPSGSNELIVEVNISYLIK